MRGKGRRAPFLLGVVVFGGAILLIAIVVRKDAPSRIDGKEQHLREWHQAAEIVSGSWRFEGNELISPQTKFGQLLLPAPPSTEYVLEIQAERLGTPESLNVGLVYLGNHFMVILDGFGGTTSGVDMLDGKPFHSNRSTVRGQQLREVLNRIRYTVKRDRLIVTVNDEHVLEMELDYSKLSLYREWGRPPTPVPFLGSWTTSYRIIAVTYEAVE